MRPSSLNNLSIRCIKLVACICLFGSSFAFAQTGRLNGRVSDPSGATLSGATIQLKNVGTGAVRTVTTKESGDYDLPSLEPGSYVVSVSHVGFETLIRTGINISVDTSTHIDIAMTVGKQTESITVDSGVPLVQPDNASLTTTISEKEFTGLPLVQVNRLRNPASFVYLAPGVQGQVALNGSDYTGATNVITVNGGPIWNTELLIEGLPAGQTRIVGNMTESSPPVDAVNEFAITTTLLSADYGHTGFAVGSFGIKSGTNDIHASVFEYFRNTALNSGNWLAKYNKSPLVAQPTHQNEFGMTVGGPVRLPHLYNGHDKTFFFFAFDGSRFTGGTSYTNSTLPSTQEFKVNGAGYYDFSDLKTPIYDPATTVANPKGSGYVRTAFAGNLIPASRIDRVAKNILSYFPASATAATTGTSTVSGFTGDNMLSPNVYTFKIDQILSQAHHLSTSYVHTDVPRINTSSSLPSPLQAGYHQTVAGTTARINESWIISPAFVNNVYIGFNRFTNAQTPIGTNADYPSLLGLSGLSGGLFPTLVMSGYTTIGNITDTNKTENDYYYKDIFSFLHGANSFRVGGEFRATQYNDRSPATTTGTFTFKANETGNPQSQTNTGNTFASFLLGQVDSGTATAPFPLYTRKKYFGFFVQDDWKAFPHLTVNLGLRFEWQTAPTEARNDQSIVSLTTPNPGAANYPGAVIFAGANGTGTSTLFATDYSAIGPRIGIAYQLHEHTVVRAGYGVYYSEFMPNTDIVNSGFSDVGKFTNATSGVFPVFTLAGGVPNYTASQSISPTVLNGTTGSFYGSKVGAMPRTQNYSLTIQHQFGRNTSLEAAYLGDHNTRQVAPNMVNINQVDPKYLSVSQATMSSTATATNLAALGASLPYTGFSGTVAQALRPYAQYSTLTSVAAKVGASNYNAGQLVFRQRLTHGLTVDGNYTYSKVMGYASTTLEGNSGNDNTVQNAYNPSADYSLLPQDVRHAVVLHYSYLLPFGRGQAFLNRSGVASAVLGGWRASAIQRYQSGFPLPLTVTNATSLFNTNQRPNLNRGVDPSAHISNGAYNPTMSIFNSTAFATPGSASFGNLAPASSNIKNYPVLTEDAGLTKETRLGDHVEWSFYSQAFNVFNRHRFGAFGTNVSNLGTFGVASSTSTARAFQFGTRFKF